jgi:hypothetical protein
MEVLADQKEEVTKVVFKRVTIIKEMCPGCKVGICPRLRIGTTAAMALSFLRLEHRLHQQKLMLIYLALPIEGVVRI